ncbi:MAG: 3-dehydroquinate synthase [Nannocystaceae bacterium]
MTDPEPIPRTLAERWRQAGDVAVHASFTVDFRYPIVFTRSVFHPDNGTFADLLGGACGGAQRKMLVWIDDGVAGAWPDLRARVRAYLELRIAHIRLAQEPSVLPGGEPAKGDLSGLDPLYRQVLRAQLDRHDFIVCVGGGALLDATGYVAATAHRGIRHIRVPTTVLAQNDSGVGVKNGINAFGCKNFVGAFAPPFAVVNDADFLRTLGRRDQVAGFAEAVKVALIRDRTFFVWLEDNAVALAAFETEVVETAVRRCAELHVAHIVGGGDAFERGSARPLDFGHWAAHKLETMTDHALRHGEAVAIGIAIDTTYSVACGRLPAQEGLRVIRLLSALGLATGHAALGRRGADGQISLLRGLEEFRQHLGGQLSITLLDAIGEGVQATAIDEIVLSKICLRMAAGC